MKKATYLLFIFFSIFLFSPVAFAATLYWVGNNGASTNTATNWKTTNPASCGGGDASAAPTAADDLIFDPDCDNGAAIDANLSANTIALQSGYTGTVTQSTGITVATDAAGGWNQAGGTFTGGDSSITITDGGFTLSGGVFTNTSGGLNIERSFTINSGTFTNTSKTMTFTDSDSNDDSTLTCSETIGGTVVITKDSSGDFILSSGCTIDLGATPTSVFGNIGIGTYTNNGTMTIASGTWTINGSGRTLTNNGTITHSGNGWVINDTSLTNNANKTITYSGTAITMERDFTQNGTFNLTGITITFGDTTTADETTVSGSVGGTVVIDKSLTSGAGCNSFILASGGSINLGANPTTTLTNSGCSATLTNNGTITIASGTWTINGTAFNSTLINAGIITHSGNGWDINNTHLTNNLGATITYSGTAITMESNFTQNGTFDLTGITITFDDASNSGDTTLTCSGTLGGTAVITKDSAGDFILASGCTINLGATPTTTLSSGTYTNNGIITIPSGTWTISGSGSSTLTNAGTITHSGNGWDMNDMSLTNNSGATITYSGTAITMERSFTQSGTFDLSGITITFDDSNSTLDDTTVTCGAGKNLGSIVVNKTNAGADTTLASDCTVTGDFTRTDGPFTNPASAYILTVQGNFSMSTTDTFGGANLTLTMGGSGNKTITQNAGTMSGVFKVDRTGGYAQLATNFTTGSTSNVVEGIFDINGKTFTSGLTFTVEDGGTLQLQGAESVTAPTLNSGSTVMYVGDNDAVADTFTITTLASTYHHLTIDGAEVGANKDTFQLGATLDVNGNLTLIDGTLDVSATPYNITLAGNWSNTSATFTKRNGTVTFDGAVAQTLTGETFYDLTINNSHALPDDTNDVDSSAAVTVTNTLTVTDGQFQPTTASSFKNVSIGAAGILKPDASASITVSGNFTNSGTFTANSGTVTLNGANGVTQTLTGTTTFYTLSKTVTGASTLSLTDTDVFTVSNSLTLKGAASNLLTVQSSHGTNTVDFDIQAGGTQVLDYLTVCRVDSATGLAMRPTNSSDTGCSSTNVNWFFAAETATFTWDGSAQDSAWNTAANWDLGLVPRTADTVTIPDATYDPTLGSAVTVANLTIQSGAILTLSGNGLTVSTTFSNQGALTLQGDESVSTPTNANPSTITYNATSGTRNIKDWTYHHLTFSGSGGTFTMGAIETLGGDLTVTAGTFTVSDVSASSAADITVTGNILVNGGTLSAAAGDIDANGNVTVSSGTFTAPTSADDTSFTVAGNWAVTGTGIFTPSATGRVIFDAGATGKTITTTSSGADDFNQATFNNALGGWTLQDSLEASGLTVTAGVLTDNAKTVTVAGSISIANTSGVLASTGTWIVSATGNITNPYFYNNKFSTLQINSNITATRTGVVYVDKLVLQSGATFAGASNLSFAYPTANDFIDDQGGDVTEGSILIYLVSNTTQKAFSVSSPVYYPYSVGITLQMTGDWTVGSFLAIYGQTTSTSEALAPVLDVNGYNLTVNGYLVLGLNSGTAGDKYYGKILMGEGTVDIKGNLFVDGDGANDSKGFINLESATVKVSGNLDLEDATVTPGTSTVIMNATSGTPVIISTGQSINNLTINDGVGEITFTLEDALDVNGNLTITDGTLDTKSGENNSINVGGNWTNSDIFTARSGTVTFDGASGTQTLNAGTSNFYGLAHSGVSTLQLITNNLTVANSLNNSAGTFDLNGKNLTATGATFSNAGTFQLQGGETITSLTQDAAKGTWTYVGDGTGAATTQTLKDFGTTDYYNLTINDTSASNKDTFQLGNPLNVAGNFTLSSGTFTHGANQNLTVAGSLAIANGATWTKGSGTSTLILSGTGTTPTLTDSSTVKQDLGVIQFGS